MNINVGGSLKVSKKASVPQSAKSMQQMSLELQQSAQSLRGINDIRMALDRLQRNKKYLNSPRESLGGKRAGFLSSNVSPRAGVTMLCSPRLSVQSLHTSGTKLLPKRNPIPPSIMQTSASTSQLLINRSNEKARVF